VLGNCIKDLATTGAYDHNVHATKRIFVFGPAHERQKGVGSGDLGPWILKFYISCSIFFKVDADWLS